MIVFNPISEHVTELGVVTTLAIEQLSVLPLLNCELVTEAVPFAPKYKTTLEFVTTIGLIVSPTNILIADVVFETQTPELTVLLYQVVSNKEPGE